jgi:anion-transporting  ArsA/GET3 family ATPase
VKELLKKGSSPILLGTGGVGKTTIAAALGLAGARANRNTAVITVDPARRLRDALGLERLGGSPTSIGEKQLRAAGLPPTLKLSAMMLDVKGAWDTVIDRFVTDAARRDRILDNPFYKSLTAEFAGSEAFAALQQLYDLHQSGGFDLEVVDTPPAAHAFEFLQTPARMIRLLDSRTSRWLFTPSLTAGRIAIKLASQAARFVVRELERFAGGNVLSTISDFFAATSDSIDAIVERLQKTEALLHSPAVRFVLVTTAEADRLRGARDLIKEMQTEELKLAAIVINRFLDERTWSEIKDSSTDPLGHLAEISTLRSELTDGASLPPGAANLINFLESYRKQTLDQIELVGKFAREIPEGVQLAITPELEVGVRDLAALSRVADYLIAGTTILKPLESAAARLRRPARTERATRSARR